MLPVLKHPGFLFLFHLQKHQKNVTSLVSTLICMSHKEIEKTGLWGIRLLRRNFRFMNLFSKKKKVKEEGGVKSGSRKKKTTSPTGKPKEKTSSAKVPEFHGDCSVEYKLHKRAGETDILPGRHCISSRPVKQ